MNVSFVYGSWSCGSRPFDFTRLYDDPRGLTGSEVSCFSYARGLAALGHSVKVFAPLCSSPTDGHAWEGVKVLPLAMWSDDRGSGADCVLSWNEPDQLRGVPSSAARIVNQQLNDFTYCQPGFDSFVDVFTSPCGAHLDHMAGRYGFREKWTVLPNGCDMGAYDGRPRIPGRVLYASSPDRGLHLLLQQWPTIRKAVPHATLRVFYNFDEWLKNLLNCEGPGHHPNLRECSYRAFYIREALHRLRDHGVEHHKSISRKRMAEEMSSAVVLAYPCDTVTYTEGFSATIMEACAAGLVPVTSKTDSLGHVYGESLTTMVDAPVANHIDEWTQLVIRSMTDSGFRESASSKMRELALRHDWPVLSKTLDRIVHDAVRVKGLS